MSDIEQKALEMISAARKEHPTPDNYLIARTALFRAIEQHEAFRQEVSDVVMAFMLDKPGLSGAGITRFIIPAPKPDPLVDVAKMMGYFNTAANAWAADVRAALDALGFEIREKSDD